VRKLPNSQWSAFSHTTKSNADEPSKMLGSFGMFDAAAKQLELAQ
jgi:hypothetical protein